MDTPKSQDQPLVPEHSPQDSVRDDANYNRTFEKLVLCFDEDTDEGRRDKLIGLLAYGLYKEDKRRYYRNFWEKYKRKLNKDDKDHIMLSFDDTRLNVYRQEAWTMLYDFAEGYLEEYEPRIKAEAEEDALARKASAVLDEKKEELSTILEKKVSFKAGFAASFLATIIWTLLIGLGIAYFSMFNPESTGGKLARAFFTDDRIIVKYESKTTDTN